VETTDPDTGEIFRMRTNSAGFKDIEHSLEKPEGTMRILILGDSVSAGWGVPLEDSIGRQLERVLKTRGVKGEVISMAVAGWSTDQELLALVHQGLNYDPDLVMLIFTLSNDVIGNLYDRAFFGPQKKPVFRISENGNLIWPVLLERTVRFARIKRFLGNLQVVRYLRVYTTPLLASEVFVEEDLDLPPDHSEAYQPRKATPEDNPVHELEGKAEDPAHDNSHFSVAIVPASPRMEYAWDLTSRILREMKTQCVESGADFILVEPTIRSELGSERERGVIVKDGLAFDFDVKQAINRLESICRDSHIDCYLPLLDYVRDRFKNDGHLNAGGASRLAHLLADYLEESGRVRAANSLPRDDPGEPVRESG
jgi:lysophospholipase L1-like esterase